MQDIDIPIFQSTHTQNSHFSAGKTGAIVCTAYDDMPLVAIFLYYFKNPI